MQHLLLWYLGYQTALSLILFIVCGYDKFAAKREWRRVPERRMLLLSALGGAAGMLAGMFVFRHKTLHLSFRILVPLLVILHYAAGLLLYVYF